MAPAEELLRGGALVDADREAFRTRMVNYHLADGLDLLVETGGAQDGGVLHAAEDGVADGVGCARVLDSCIVPSYIFLAKLYCRLFQRVL